MSTEPSVSRSALFGAVAALIGLAAGDLAAALIAPAASPVLVVGSTLIDLAPAAVKTAVIESVGTADKPVLVTLVVLGGLGLGALAGMVGRRRPGVAAVILIGLGAAIAFMATTRPNLGQFGIVPAMLTGGVSAGILTLLHRTASADPSSSDADDVGRRALVTSVGLVVIAGLTASIARSLRRRSVPVQTVSLPRPTEHVAPLPRGLSANGITRFRTPEREFYRVDTRLSIPSIDVDGWRLRIDGDVARPTSVSYNQLLRMPMIERDITLVCVSNPVGGPYAGGARWLGVRLTDVLELAGRGKGKADQILSTDVGGMTISTPLAAATDGRDAMIAVGMNGMPLPREHGFPARLIVPGLYGFIGATKWITRMTLTTYAAQDAYWTQRGWSRQAPIKLASRIDTPRDGEELDAGDVIIGGIAWAQADRGVGKVQVRIDDGPWRDATLGPSGGAAYWRQWFLRWKAGKGEHRIAVRTVAADGEVQTGKVVDVIPDGATGYHTVSVSIA